MLRCFTCITESISHYHAYCELTQDTKIISRASLTKTRSQSASGRSWARGLAAIRCKPLKHLISSAESRIIRCEHFARPISKTACEQPRAVATHVCNAITATQVHGRCGAVVLCCAGVWKPIRVERSAPAAYRARRTTEDHRIMDGRIAGLRCMHSMHSVDS
eukprot:COSAG01_NODE_30370_length_617_cov_0.835907_1_plen_161_part_10